MWRSRKWMMRGSLKKALAPSPLPSPPLPQRSALPCCTSTVGERGRTVPPWRCHRSAERLRLALGTVGEELGRGDGSVEKLPSPSPLPSPPLPHRSALFGCTSTVGERVRTVPPTP